VYIIFYLQAVGNADNLGLVYHVAQRVKGHQDGIVAKDTQLLEVVNERLYMLSDLSQGLIRRFLDHNGWTLQAWPGKVKLPAGIFRLMDDAEQGREVAMKNYLPTKFEEGLDEEVKRLLSKASKKVCNGIVS
jgi:sister-chromatid-cohesion protein PDS5